MHGEGDGERYVRGAGWGAGLAQNREDVTTNFQHKWKSTTTIDSDLKFDLRQREGSLIKILKALESELHYAWMRRSAKVGADIARV